MALREALKRCAALLKRVQCERARGAVGILIRCSAAKLRHTTELAINALRAALLSSRTAAISCNTVFTTNKLSIITITPLAMALCPDYPD